MLIVEKYAKAFTSFLILAFAAVALFWGGDIFGFHIEADFQTKVIALIPLAVAVVGVLLTKNATPDAVDKAVTQLITGGLAVANFFTTIPSDLGVKIGGFCFALIAAVYMVWRVPNAVE